MDEPNEELFPTDEFFSTFLEDIQQSVRVEIPIQLKKHLYVNGYRDWRVIAQITDQDLQDIENFAKETLPKLLNNKKQHGEYYGIFVNNISEFKLLNGQRKLLKMIVDHYKSVPSTTAGNKKLEKSREKREESNTSNKLVTKRIGIPEESENIVRSICNWIQAKCPGEKWSEIRESIKGIEVVPESDKNGNILGIKHI